MKVIFEYHFSKLLYTLLSFEQSSSNRCRISLKREANILLIIIEGNDISIVRAFFNTYMRYIAVAEGIDNMLMR